MHERRRAKMKFDTLIVGGGLAGLTCGIALAQEGKRVAIVSAGQSTLHFASGSFDLLGYDAHGAVAIHPLEAIEKLPATHPYKKVGNVEHLATQAKQLLAEAGIATTGCHDSNHMRITPIGTIKPTWLSLNGQLTIANDKAPIKKVALVNIIGYLDFPTKLIAHGLREMGVDVEIKPVTVHELIEARKSATEMRATNIAKVLNNDNIIDRLAQEITAATQNAQTILFPAVLGIKDDHEAQQLIKRVNKPLHYIATMPPSAIGTRVQHLLRKRFEALGGTFLNGDKVVGGNIEDNTLVNIVTERLDNTLIEATNYVIATGSFMSRGLVADYEKVYEPILGLDVDHDAQRTQWTRDNVWDAQPYMEYGVSTNTQLQAIKDGRVMSNVYAAGQILSGNNHVKLASSEGVDMLTALAVARNIIKK